MKRFISFSGGVESTAMCVLYGKGATAIFADTGAEPNAMYERIDYAEKTLKEIHEGDFTLIRLRAKVNVKGEEVEGLPDYIRGYKYFPSMMNRFCTRLFKIDPIDIFLKEQGECELLIGFNADEEPGKDRTGNFMSAKNVHYRYPLFDENITRMECEEILYENKLSLDWPFYMQRGGCFMCFYKGLSELKAMYFFGRDQFDKIRELEEGIRDARKRPYTAMLGTGKTLAQIAKECDEEVSNWGLDSVLKMYKKGKSSSACGAFCHR
jgi:3'-phosphoadenosine 5'-phosphosulfate sulfotransferase (PAPS reductase)/FAD synthetase